MAVRLPKRRQALLAGVAALLAAGVGTSLSVLPGASAQTNSRLCGRYWTNSDTEETVVLLYEVRKGDSGTCNWAKALNPVGRDSRDHNDAPWTLKESKNPNWSTDSLKFEVCEEFKPKHAGGRDWTFEGGGWPRVTDRNDICLNMNRSDTTFEMERYWLYDDGTHGTWKFTRD